MRRRRWRRCQIILLAATTSLVIQFPAYAEGWEAEADGRPATPSEATIPSAADQAEVSEDAVKLLEYQKEGVLLAEDDQNVVDGYMTPLVSSRQSRAVLIGTGFYPYSYKLDHGQYSAVADTAMKMETLWVDGTDYHVAVYSISYQHEHEFTEKEISPSCLLEGLRQKICETCGYTEDTVIARLGHVDGNGDSICDRCGSTLITEGVGTVLSVGTGLSGDYKTMEFVCIDENYQGGRLFLSRKIIPYGMAPGYGKGSAGGDYTSSSVRRWLNDTFFENLSTAGQIKKVALPESTDGLGDYVFCLSKEEAGQYAEETMEPWQSGGKDAYYWTRSQDETIGSYTYCVSSSGHVASRPATDRSGGVRPAFVLEGADEGEAQERIYLEGDVQERQMNGRSYRFRCVDSDYADAQGNQIGALFLCDSIIGGDEAVFDNQGQNSWAGSSAREWLSNHMENRTDLAEADTTVEASFSGKTTHYGNSLAIGSFTGTPLPGNQVVATKDTVFCLSLEEAIRYQNYLWRLDGAVEDNFTNAGTYTSGYWLRTPGTFGQSTGYFVSYEGQIMAGQTDNRSIGIRPAYVVKQK